MIKAKKSKSKKKEINSMEERKKEKTWLWSKNFLSSSSSVQRNDSKKMNWPKRSIKDYDDDDDDFENQNGWRWPAD